MAKGKKCKDYKKTCSNSTGAGRSTKKENDNYVSIARHRQTSSLSSECTILKHNTFKTCESRVFSSDRTENDRTSRGGVKVVPNGVNQDIVLDDAVWRGMLQNCPGIGEGIASEIQNANESDQTEKTPNDSGAIASTLQEYPFLSQRSPGCIPVYSLHNSLQDAATNSAVFSDGSVRDVHNADYQFLLTDTGHPKEYIERRMQERGLSVLHHQNRMTSDEGSASDCVIGFPVNNGHQYVEEDSILVKECCKECLGIVVDINFKDLGTCWHIGEGNVVTCYHVIPPRALYTSNRLYRGYLRIIFPYNPLKVPVYDVKEDLPSVSIDNDYAVLKMNMKEQTPWPPFFQNFYISNNNQEEFPLFTVGYQLDGKLFGELIVDLGVVRKTPSEREVQVLNEYMRNAFYDEDSYGGLLREGNVCQYSSLIQGASGGVGVCLNTNKSGVDMVSMYQRGYPKYYYDNSTTFAEKEAFPSSLKIESGISMSKLFSEMTLGI